MDAESYGVRFPAEKNLIEKNKTGNLLRDTT